MKCTVILDKTREQEILIYAHERNELINNLERIATGEDQGLIGFSREEIVRLNTNDVFCFTVDCGKLFAVCENERYLLKARLCSVEDKLDKNFIKINQSSIANINKIKKFDASISGTLKVIFKNGYTDYVSRRNIRNVKERIGL